MSRKYFFDGLWLRLYALVLIFYSFALITLVDHITDILYRLSAGVQSGITDIDYSNLS